MGLPGCPEIGFDPKMQAQGATAKPTTATRGQVGRLNLFGEAHQVDIKGPRTVFLARRHGELHMVKAQQFEAMICHGADCSLFLRCRQA
jgi:hypothetical protein